MEYESKDIIACEILDKRMTAMKSTAMEKEGLVRALNDLVSKGLRVTEICTDAHPQITSMLSMYSYLVLQNCTEKRGKGVIWTSLKKLCEIGMQ